ncbi:hypothetical protein L3X38_020121 [Prunus dulcis]|uniref:Uncharacterized protein n=1 Tax=Prunus dulcis TaxID=3755 RepID=A0AAD4WEX2_PRUDU|nr:hypothetical protein L3X38_020121 [Prunus dulcis]
MGQATVAGSSTTRKMELLSGIFSPSPQSKMNKEKPSNLLAVERFAHDDKGDFATSLKHFIVKTSTEE